MTKIDLKKSRQNHNLTKRWKARFWHPVQRRIPNDNDGMLFHTFGFQRTKHLVGKRAVSTYEKKKCSDFYIMVEDGDSRQPRFIHIAGRSIPDCVELEALRSSLQSFADVYVMDREFHWTFCITHEDTAGPYFCEPAKVKRS